MKLRSIIVTIAVAIGMLLGMSFAGADVIDDKMAELTNTRTQAIQKLREVQEQAAYIQRYVNELNGGIATIKAIKVQQEAEVLAIVNTEIERLEEELGISEEDTVIKMTVDDDKTVYTEPKVIYPENKK